MSGFLSFWAVAELALVVSSSLTFSGCSGAAIALLKRLAALTLVNPNLSLCLISSLAEVSPSGSLGRLGPSGTERRRGTVMEPALR